MSGTFVTHRACGTPIYFVEGGLHDGVVIPPASAFHPLDSSWPQPHDGDETRCPACGAVFLMSDTDLLREHTSGGETWTPPTPTLSAPNGTASPTGANAP